MSDQGFEAGNSSQPSAGALLRAAREKQGLHIAALAAAIKVAPRKLDALENDRWDELPDATFTRALAQTVCRTLKIDARPVLALLPSGGPASLGPNGGGLNMPFRERSGRDEPGIGSAAIKPMVAVAVLLMVAAVAVYLLPDTLWTRSPAADTPAVSAPATAASVAEPVAAPAPTAAASEPAAGAADETTPIAFEAPASTPSTVSVAVPTPAHVAAPAPAAVVPSAIVKPAVPAPVATASSPTMPALLQVRTSAPSWVEVRDARGQVLLSRLVLAGENVGLNGSLPLRLTIGNAGSTSLAFRGRAVDLSGKTSNNVARLELQ